MIIYINGKEHAEALKPRRVLYLIEIQYLILKS